MGTKAIFKIYNNNKFVIGSWVKHDGGVNTTSIFPYFLKNLKYDVDKKSIYDTINQFIADNNYGVMFGDKKKPFSRQRTDEGMTECEVLFWDIPLSDKKLMKEYVWAEYTYEVRFSSDRVKIIINYNGNEKTYELKGYWNTTSIIKIVGDVNKWIDDIEYGLNDCDCKDEKPPIERKEQTI
jgi:hypothetical protein